MRHPARVSQKHQKREQPEVQPENETSYQRGGNLHVVCQMHSGDPPYALIPPEFFYTTVRQSDGIAHAQDHGMVTRASPKSISSPGMISFFTAPRNNPPVPPPAGLPCRAQKIQRGPKHGQAKVRQGEVSTRECRQQSSGERQAEWNRDCSL